MCVCTNRSVERSASSIKGYGVELLNSLNYLFEIEASVTEEPLPPAQ